MSKNENIAVIKGKININETIKNKINRKNLISCDYDELSENNIYNQILKTTADILLHHQAVNKERKIELKKVFLFFNEVDTIDPFTIKWNMLRFERSNRNYELIITICRFIIEECILATDKGDYKINSFLYKNIMSSLYEKFVLAYYKYHHGKLKPTSEKFRWYSETDNLLPVMKTDISLEYENKALIIDTKYYTNILVINSQHKNNSNPKLRSSHLYQIFAYVKNKDTNNNGNVAGMLLYAKTDEEISPNCDFNICENTISVKTLDLGIDFNVIRTQLDQIVIDYFPTYKYNKV